MSAAPKRKMTAAEYLEIERAAEFKSEFYDGVMYPLHRGPDGMAGASSSHNRVKENLIGEMFSQLKGSPCSSYSSDQRVQLTPTGMFAYPDIVIVCGKSEFDAEVGDILLNPKVVFEVLSPSTEKYDRGFKFAQYQLQPTLMEYVLVAQDSVRIELFVRQPDNTWLLTNFTDLSEPFSLKTVPVSIPVADVYRGIDFTGT